MLEGRGGNEGGGGLAGWFGLWERGFRGVFAAVGQFPGGAVAEEFLDEGGVHGVAGSLGDDAAPDAVAGKGEVADEVEDLVADELVWKAQGAILNGAGESGGGAGEDDGGLVGYSADEAHIAKHGLVFLEAKGAGGGDEVGVGSGFEVAGEGIAADGFGEVDGVVDGVAVAGVEADELVALGGGFLDFDGLEDADVLTLAALALEAVGEDGGDVRKGAAVEDRDFEVIDFDDDVVDAEADECGEEVLGGLDEDALAHEGGGVGDARDIAAGGGDLEVVEVRTAEDDAGAGGRGNEAHGDFGAGVEADSLEVQRGLDGLLELGRVGQAGARARLTNGRV
jgi:hypothetical protein